MPRNHHDSDGWDVVVIVVFPKCVVAKCKSLTGCDHCHIKFKFDRSICDILLVGALMMHINIVIMQKVRYIHCTLYSLYTVHIHPSPYMPVLYSYNTNMTFIIFT